MSDDTLDPMLAELVRQMDRPPDPPRDAMWAAISAERQRARDRARFGRQWPKWLVWAPALAASLVLGIVVGRWSMTSVESPVTVAGLPDDRSREVYTQVAMQHLSSAEALLVAFPQDARAGRTADVAHWAAELLTDTRLLADSPAGDDAELGRLLGDLELVLAQIAALATAPRGTDVGLIEDGISSTDVLVRLRAATANGGAAGL